MNTGNKSGAPWGLHPYGDTAGAFAPLGGVYKTDVFAMAPAGATPPGRGGGRAAPFP